MPSKVPFNDLAIAVAIAVLLLSYSLYLAFKLRSVMQANRSLVGIIGSKADIEIDYWIVRNFNRSKFEFRVLKLHGRYFSYTLRVDGNVDIDPVEIETKHPGLLKRHEVEENFGQLANFVYRLPKHLQQPIKDGALVVTGEGAQKELEEFMGLATPQP